jgi:transcriptional regulator with GAF, ATPase, and Fis domain
MEREQSTGEALEAVLDYRGWTYRVALGSEPLVFGRSGDCDVAVPDPEMSRRHCRLARDSSGAWVIEDLGSQAGTAVAGERLRGPAPMPLGAVAQLGATRLWIATRSAVAPEPAASARWDGGSVELLLKTIGELYGSEDLGALLRTIVDRALLVAGGERGALLLAGEGGVLEVAVARGSGGEDLPLPESLTRSLPKRALELGQAVVVTDTQAPGQLEATPQSVFLGGLRSVLCVPLPGAGGPMGVLYVDARRPAESFGPSELAIFEAMAVHSALAIERSRMQEERARNEREERQRLRSENAALKAQLGVAAPIGESAAMKATLALAERVAGTDATVCLVGETGTGKEVLARHIHGLSPRSKGPFVVVDCGSIPETLIESELFGHKKGSFTGATENRAGRFREAQGGTVFLDEVGELPLSMQPRLLRVMQEKTIQPVGASERVGVDVRVVCATHRDLGRMVGEGKFREDLYYRLAVLSVPIPPLRERGQDILLLAEQFLGRYAGLFGVGVRFTRETREALLGHGWPGNVRELENRVQRAVLLARPPFVTRQDLGLEGAERPSAAGERPSAGLELPTLQEARAASDERFERTYLEEVLRRAGANVSKAAALAGVSRQLLTRLIARHKIDRTRFAGDGA